MKLIEKEKKGTEDMTAGNGFDSGSDGSTEASSMYGYVGKIDLKFDHGTQDAESLKSRFGNATISDDGDVIDVSINVRLTRGITETIIDNAAFGGFVARSILKFALTDWGTLGAEDREANQETLEDDFGMVMGAYEFQDGAVTIWIVQHLGATDGEENPTVLLPTEY